MPIAAFSHIISDYRSYYKTYNPDALINNSVKAVIDANYSHITTDEWEEAQTHLSNFTGEMRAAADACLASLNLPVVPHSEVVAELEELKQHSPLPLSEVPEDTWHKRDVLTKTFYLKDDEGSYTPHYAFFYPTGHIDAAYPLMIIVEAKDYEVATHM